MAASDTDTKVEEDAGGREWDLARTTGVVGAVLVAVALAIGAAVVGDPGRGEVDDPAAYVRSFYEGGDVAGLMGALAPGSIPEDQLSQAERDLQQLLRPEVEVVDTRELELDGETVTQVTTSDRLVWCVDRAGTLYVRCRVGEAPVEVTVGNQPLEASLAQLDVFPDRAELTFGLVATDGETVTFGETVELEGTGDTSEQPVQLVQTVGTVGGQLAPVQLAEYQLTGDATLFLVWHAPREAVTGRTLTFTWDGGSIEIDVGEAELFS